MHEQHFFEAHTSKIVELELPLLRDASRVLLVVLLHLWTKVSCIEINKGLYDRDWQ